MNPDGRKRVVVERVRPEVDGGLFPAKRAVGETVEVLADIFADGHDEIAAAVLYRTPGEKKWREVPMRQVGNDRWSALFPVEEIGEYTFTVQGWIDHPSSWRRDLRKKFDAGQDIAIDLRAGIELIRAAEQRAGQADLTRLKAIADSIAALADTEPARAVSAALSEELGALFSAYPDRSLAVDYHRTLSVVGEPAKALFSTWYELFPRSCPGRNGSHGTFQDCIRILPEISSMGFDVLYLPPIHPIGMTKRKGKNNAVTAGPDDVGSPWAIGSEEGGHDAIHPSLGSFDDFSALVRAASGYGIDVALDIAFQCSPDHPYVKEHPEWFRRRPDGSVQYAENPPKKYEDIYPFDFECADWRSLWNELRRVLFFWIDKGIRIFRVDNPHTKSFAFWEWVISEVRREYPEAIFLSEAFTRPKVKYRLAKIGFTQSYTYFTWRYTQREFKEYMTELTRSGVRDFFRPNFWPNTPDILPEHLQYGGRPAFVMRLVLAATLASNYGVYGPAFELCIADAVTGKEEYLDSEKYELKNWDWDREGNLKDFISRMNAIRRENPALQSTFNLEFFDVDNDQMICYGKTTDDLSNILVVVVNLDPYRSQSGWIRIPISRFGIGPNQPYLVHDLIGNDRYIWEGERNFVELNPSASPAYILRIRRRLKRESDFDYFM